jgi:Na+-translocating ferredoxin:NAD+ oxidoreductase RnfC subunit
MGLAEAVREAGVLGAGGAGFPAHVKYQRDAEILIVNGAECEPLAHKDEAVLAERAADVVAAVAALREELGAREVILAVKESRHRRLQGLYGGIKVYPLAEFYPAGDEAVLVYEVAGRRVPAAGIPPDVGVVVSNAETIWNVARAGRGKKVTTTWVTVAGAVAEPFTAEVPLGTTAAFLIAEAGGPTVPGHVVFDGGPMMGEEINDPAAYGVQQTTGLILVLPWDTPAAVKARLPLEHVRTVAGSACTQCRDCTELCPRYLLGYDVQPHLSMRRFFSWGEEADPAFFASASGCTGCGLCELYACPMEIAPRRVQNHLRQRLEGTTPAEGAGEVHADRGGRRVPGGRLRRRLDVASWDGAAPPRELREEPRRLVLNLVQPYARPLEVAVREGDVVEPGQAVAAPAAEDERGVSVYASLGGRVVAANGRTVEIDRTQVAGHAGG